MQKRTDLQCREKDVERASKFNSFESSSAQKTKSNVFHKFSTFSKVIVTTTNFNLLLIFESIALELSSFLSLGSIFLSLASFLLLFFRFIGFLILDWRFFLLGFRLSLIVGCLCFFIFCGWIRNRSITHDAKIKIFQLIYNIDFTIKRLK